MEKKYLVIILITILMVVSGNFVNAQALKSYSCTVHHEDLSIEADSLSDAKSKALFRCLVTYKAGTSCYEKLLCSELASESANIKNNDWPGILLLSSVGLVGTIGLLGLIYCFCVERRGPALLTEDV